MEYAIGAGAGLLIGLIAGYFGKWVDDGVQYTYTTLDSIPGILLLISLLMAMGRGCCRGRRLGRGAGWG